MPGSCHSRDVVHCISLLYPQPYVPRILCPKSSIHTSQLLRNNSNEPRRVRIRFTADPVQDCILVLHRRRGSLALRRRRSAFLYARTEHERRRHSVARQRHHLSERVRTVSRPQRGYCFPGAPSAAAHPTVEGRSRRESCCYASSAVPRFVLRSPFPLGVAYSGHNAAVYPRTYDPSYAVSCCILAVIFAAAFALIFPLLAPAVLLLLFLTLLGKYGDSFYARVLDLTTFLPAHRFLIGYVYGRTHSQTGGLLQIWLLRRLGKVLAFQPLLFGLIFLTRRLWIEGGILVGTAFCVVVANESFCNWRTRPAGRSSLSPITVNSLSTFERTANPGKRRDLDEENTSLVSSSRMTRARGSFASVLEMMSLTLAVTPSPSETRGPVPLGPCSLVVFSLLSSTKSPQQKQKPSTTSRPQNAPPVRTPTRHRTFRHSPSPTTQRRCLVCSTPRSSSRRRL